MHTGKEGNYAYKSTILCVCMHTCSHNWPCPSHYFSCWTSCQIFTKIDVNIVPRCHPNHILLLSYNQKWPNGCTKLVSVSGPHALLRNGETYEQPLPNMGRNQCLIIVLLLGYRENKNCSLHISLLGATKSKLLYRQVLFYSRLMFLKGLAQITMWKLHKFPI